MKQSKHVKLAIVFIATTSICAPVFAGSNATYNLKTSSTVTSEQPGTTIFSYGDHTLGENLSFQFKRGMHHFGNGNYADASQAFHRVLRTNPRHPYANYYMGLSKQNMGNHRMAARHLRYSSRVFASVPQVHAALGKSLAARGDYEGARRVLADLKALDAKCGGTCASSKDIKTAKQIVKAALRS